MINKQFLIAARSDNYLRLFHLLSRSLKGLRGEFIPYQNCLDVTYQDSDGNTALMLACKYGGVETVNILLISEVVHITNCAGETALMIAVKRGSFEIVELLTEKDVDVDISFQNIKGETALMHACCQEDVKIVKLLLAHEGFECINAADNDGNTALMLACRYNKTEIAELLLDHEDIDINVENYLYQTALSCAITHNNTKLVNLLEQRGAK